MASVFIVQHVHVHPNGDECIKLIGAYSSRARALDAVSRVRTQPGFRECPRLVNPLEDDDQSGFYVDECTVDHDDWDQGFITV